jgi:hypothetical protein
MLAVSGGHCAAAPNVPLQRNRRGHDLRLQAAVPQAGVCMYLVHTCTPAGGKGCSNGGWWWHHSRRHDVLCELHHKRRLSWHICVPSSPLLQYPCHRDILAIEW